MRADLRAPHQVYDDIESKSSGHLFCVPNGKEV